MKRFVIVISDKGGTGKSTIAKSLADRFRRKVQHAFLQDADGGVGQLVQCYGERAKDGKLKPEQNGLIGVRYFSVFQPRERDAILEGIESGADRVLIDMPAGTIGLLENIDREIGLFDIARQKGYGVTIVNVITPVLASVRTVGTVVDTFRDVPDVAFVVARNMAFGPEPDDWELFDESRGRAALLELGGVELTMPAMRMRTYSQIDGHSLSFSAAAHGDRLRTADRSVAYRWITQMDQQFDTAGGLL